MKNIPGWTDSSVEKEPISNETTNWEIEIFGKKYGLM